MKSMQRFLSVLVLGAGLLILRAGRPKDDATSAARALAAVDGGEAALGSALRRAVDLMGDSSLEGERALLNAQLELLRARIGALRGELVAQTARAERCGELPQCAGARMSPEPLANPYFPRRLHGATATPGVTAATHLSTDRLSALTQLCATWDGRISAAILSAGDAGEAAFKVWCSADDACGCREGAQARVRITLVTADPLVRRAPSLYPVNTLRNAALAAVVTVCHAPRPLLEAPAHPTPPRRTCWASTPTLRWVGRGRGAASRAMWPGRRRRFPRARCSCFHASR